MSTPASGGAEAANSSQAESSPPSAIHAKGAGVDATGVHATVAGVDGPRRGLRTRKPTSRAAGLDLIEAPSQSQASQQPATRSSRKRKAADASIEPENVTEHEVDTVFAGSVGSDKQEGDEDVNQYCICRGTDDGSFMISCEHCQEWFHTKCVGMTQKAAKKLDDYVCESCADKATSAGEPAASKPMKKYKSSKGRQAAQAAKAQTTEPARDEEEKQAIESEEDSASDSDEYIAEAGDDASNHEDTTMQDVSEPSMKKQQGKQSAANASLSKAKKDGQTLGVADNSSKRRASESQRPASATSRIATTSKKGASRKPSGPTDASTEEARSRARKVLATALEKIFVGTTEKRPNEADEEAQTDEQRAEGFAALLEEELFEANADIYGSIRVVGSKYKDRFRTFLFSLKDAKNTTLHSRIASGQLEASELAKMSNEELANDAIRQATEKARLDALHRSTLRTDEAGPLRKMTHKGEIEIESDTFVARDQPGKFERMLDASKETDNPPATRITESEPTIRASGMDDENSPQDATALTFSRDDPERRSAPAPSLTQDSPTRLNFGEVWTQSEEVSADNQIDEPQESYGFGGASPHDADYDHSIAADADHDATGVADDFIDSFLDGPNQDLVKETGGVDSTVSEQQVRSTTPSAEPPSSAVHRYRNIIWNGLIDLPDIFAFQGHVKQVAGRSLSSAARVWPKFFPERPLLIAGRLPTKAAVDYLLQVANAPKTEILAFSMEPGASKDGAARPQDSDLASYDGMLKHFKNADRWGALHISSSVKGHLIKDFYVVPLFKDEEVPLWLDMVESDCLGADWHAKRDRDLLVLVAVVVRDALQAELSKAERSPSRHRSVTTDGEAREPEPVSGGSTIVAEEAYDPSAGLSIPLGKPNTSVPGAVPGGAPTTSAAFGSDALQSLLRTLGKTTAAQPSAGVSATVPGGLSPFGAAPPGPPPPGPPPGPPPAFSGVSVPAIGASTAGSRSPHPAPEAGGFEPQHWQQQPPYSGYHQGYPGPADTAAHGRGGGWARESSWTSSANIPVPPQNATPPQPQEMPEEEYPGQYNPDFLAQATTGAPRGGAGFGGRGRGHGPGPGQGFGGGRGGGGWARGRGW
ncbi:hypothetical protein EX895_000837 [Sporisorium graminicola]|uniref:Transcription factor BYE1 n=1 Tax=Sporisorium graminicola TaxID=280036 RepID=A0A4V6EUJ2_9BASI|nr:hypothetical protein EX895_000837 [Sporisorium graminicola]TKY90839.1 hypothetical protein EX895_000837 [Sporisorium graminicola]